MKLKYEYRDAIIRSVDFFKKQDIVLGVALADVQQGADAGLAVDMFFYHIENFAEVKSQLDTMARSLQRRDYLDKIVGIDQDENQRFILSLAHHGSLMINAKSLMES